MTKVSWVGEYLTQHHIPFNVRQHREVYRSQDIAHELHTKGKRIAKVVVAMADSQPIMLVLPSSRFVDFAKAEREIGLNHLRLATENEIDRHFPGTPIGAMPPLKHWGETPIYLDDGDFAKDSLAFAAGAHDEAVLLEYYDWVQLVHPKLARFAVKTRPLEAAPFRHVLIKWLVILLVSSLAALAMSQLRDLPKIMTSNKALGPAPITEWRL